MLLSVSRQVSRASRGLAGTLRKLDKRAWRGCSLSLSRWKDDEMAISKIAPRNDNRRSGDERRKAFEDYTLAVGKITHACNYLNEQLSQLFVTITGIDRATSLAIWYSTESDKIQRNMLSAAMRASNKFNFKIDDLKWLLDRCEELSLRCIDSVNTPSSQYLGNGDNSSAITGVSYIYGHPRAKNLIGRKLLDEFDWCERYAFALSVFTAEAESSLSSNGRYPWPNRPQAPVPRLKKDRLTQNMLKKTK